MDQKSSAFQTALSSQLYCMLTNILVYEKWKKLSRFSASPAQQESLRTEVFKSKRTPAAPLGFPRRKTRKRFHVRDQIISASRDFHSYTVPLTEEVMSGQTLQAGIVQLIAWRIITYKLAVSHLTKGLIVLLPFWHSSSLSLPLPRKQSRLSLKLDSLWNGYGFDIWEDNLELRVKSVEIGWSEKSPLAIHYSGVCDLLPIRKLYRTWA